MRANTSYHEVAALELGDIREISTDPWDGSAIEPYRTCTIRLTGRDGTTTDIPVFGASLQIIESSAKTQS